MKISTVFLFFASTFLAPADDKQKSIVVNVDRQTLLAYEGDKLVHEFDCITGRAGKETTPGDFKIFKKDKNYISKKYKVPMPYSMFFTQDGKAIHQTPFAKPRSYAKYLGIADPGSHGCVGLSEDDARTLYDWAPLQTPVKVVEK